MLKLRAIEWIKAVDELGRNVFGLSAADYADSAVNEAAVQRTLEQRKAQVKYYRNCIAGLGPPKPAKKPWYKFWN